MLTGDVAIAINRGRRGFEIPLADLHWKFNGGPTDRRNGPRVWDLNIPTKTQCMDAERTILLGDITSIRAHDPQPVLQLGTATGESIRATADHLLPTPEGDRRLSELQPGDHVYVARRDPASPKTWRRRKYRVVNGMHHHPFAAKWLRYREDRPGPTRCATVPLHRLMFEAHLNGMSFQSFKACVQSGAIAGLQFVDTAKFEVHHRDGNHLHNQISNLELLGISTHREHHARETTWRHVLATGHPTEVLSIEEHAAARIYTIEVDPHHTCVPSGIVVRV